MHFSIDENKPPQAQEQPYNHWRSFFAESQVIEAPTYSIVMFTHARLEIMILHPSLVYETKSHLEDGRQ